MHSLLVPYHHLCVGVARERLKRAFHATEAACDAAAAEARERVGVSAPSGAESWRDVALECVAQEEESEAHLVKGRQKEPSSVFFGIYIYIWKYIYIYIYTCIYIQYMCVYVCICVYIHT